MVRLTARSRTRSGSDARAKSATAPARAALPHGRAQPSHRHSNLLEYRPSRRSSQIAAIRRPDRRARAPGPYPAHQRIPVAKAPITDLVVLAYDSAPYRNRPEVDNFLHALLETATPPLALATALCVATGNDPHLKRVLTDHISLPQETVLQEDATDILRYADGKTSPTTMRHITRAMGYLPAELAMQPMPIPPDHRARIIRAAQVVQLPQHLIRELQREL